MTRIMCKYTQSDNKRLLGKVRFINPCTGEVFESATDNYRVNSGFKEHGVGRWVDQCGAVLHAAVSNAGNGGTVAAESQAFKADAGKPDFDLLMSGMPNALLGVVKVLSWAVAPTPLAPWPDGGKGYKPHSWQQVPEAKRRYRAALMRHQNAIALGEINDRESGLSHWYHIATNALFLAELETITEVQV